jgi:hypothetical protein
MTPPPGNVRPDGHGGLRVVIEGIEHLITAPDVAYLNDPPRYARDATAGDENTKLRAVREARETAKLLLEVQGELATNPVINISLIETQLNEIRALVLGDLCPACQAAVAQRLKDRKQQREIPCQ